MSRSLVLLLIVLAVLGFSLWYLLQENGNRPLIRSMLEGARELVR